MMKPNSKFLQYLMVTSAIGLTVGGIHGSMQLQIRSVPDPFPHILTHAVGGMIIAQYFPVAVPYYFYNRNPCPYIR
jgi:hypothetical protein